MDSNPDDYIVWFDFRGKGLEFFKIWIVNLTLMILTLGVYSAWAKVRKLRYIYGSTRLDDKAFAYLADPLRILFGRVLALIVFGGYFVLWEFFPDSGVFLIPLGAALVPVIMITSIAFQRRNSSYRHLRFYFRREFGDAYRMLIVPAALLFVVALIITLWFQEQFNLEEQGTWNFVQIVVQMMATAIIFVVPYLDYVRSKFMMTRTQYGKVTAEFHANVFQFYWVYFSTFLLWILIFMVLIFPTMYLLEDRIEEFATIGPIFFVTLGITYLSMFFVMAMLRARRTNLVVEAVVIKGHGFISRLKTLPVLWIYVSNAVLIILTLGMFVPYAKIRMLRYVAANTGIVSTGLTQIEAEIDQDQDAFGEELGEFFDLDFGI